MPVLTQKIEKSITAASNNQDSLERARNALSLTRFFLFGHQIDPSFFHGVLETYTRLIPFLSQEMPLRSELLELIQVCMSIHSGHPEKYKESIEILEQENGNDNQTEATLLTEEQIEKVKNAEAWMPLSL